VLTTIENDFGRWRIGRRASCWTWAQVAVTAGGVGLVVGICVRSTVGLLGDREDWRAEFEDE
jgi:hypothetical protein